MVRLHLGSFHTRKLDLRQKQIILLSKIAILLLKGYFKREKIILQEKNLKHRKIILLKNFIFDPTFYLIASYQILKNYAILINHESFFQRKDFPQLHRFQFSKINSLMAETINFPKRNFYKQIAEFDNNIFIFENWKWLS